MAIGTAATIALGMTGIGIAKSASAQNKMTRQSDEALQAQLKLQKEQRARLDEQKKIY